MIPKKDTKNKERVELEPGASPELAKRFKYFRKYVKLTQIQLAESLDTSQTSINHYENCQRNIQIDIIKKLHDVHGMNYNWFFEGLGKPTEKPEKGNITTDIQAIKITTNVLELKIKDMEKQMITLTRELFAMKHA
jgi:transcriptional regulator with XRE-family HTH domain